MEQQQTQQETTTNDQKNKPVFKARARNVEAAVWAQKTEKSTFYTVSLQRNYKDKQTDQWKATSASFTMDDIPRIQLVLDECYRHIMLRKGEE